MGVCNQLTEYEEFLRAARLYASVLALVNTKSDFTTGVLSVGTKHKWQLGFHTQGQVICILAQEIENLR